MNEHWGGCGKTTSFMSVWLHRQPLHQCLVGILSSAQTSQNLVTFSCICLGREPKPNTFLGFIAVPDSACILSSVTREPCSPYCQCLPTSSPASNGRPFRASLDTGWDCTQRHCNTQRPNGHRPCNCTHCPTSTFNHRNQSPLSCTPEKLRSPATQYIAVSAWNTLLPNQPCRCSVHKWFFHSILLLSRG